MEKKDRLEAYGVFKPVGHVVVSFPTEDDALAAQREMRQAGFDDVVHYTPQRMIEQADRDIADAGMLAAIGQELNLVKAHRDLAVQGSSFLVVAAPKDAQAQEVAAIARRFHASRAQSYGHFLIEELIEVGGTEKQVAESSDRGLDAQTPTGHEQT